MGALRGCSARKPREPCQWSGNLTPIREDDVKLEEQTDASAMLKDLEPQEDVKGGGMYWDDGSNWT